MLCTAIAELIFLEDLIEEVNYLPKEFLNALCFVALAGAVCGRIFFTKICTAVVANIIFIGINMTECVCVGILVAVTAF